MSDPADDIFADETAPTEEPTVEEEPTVDTQEANEDVDRTGTNRPQNPLETQDIRFQPDLEAQTKDTSPELAGEPNPPEPDSTDSAE